MPHQRNRTNVETAKHKTQLNGMVKTTWIAIQLLLDGIRLELLEHRATSSTGKPVSILRGNSNTSFLPSFIHGSLFSACLDYLIFVLTRH